MISFNSGATLPIVLRNSTAIGVGNNIYLFGGSTKSGSSNVNTDIIYKTTNGTTLTQLSTTLPYILSYSSIALINDNAYIFGGSGTTVYNTIIKISNL